jgi:hypothetical protein
MRAEGANMPNSTVQLVEFELVANKLRWMRTM